MTDPKFTIGGVDYPVPVIGAFDMDEAEILYDETGYVLSDFTVVDEDGEPVRVDEVVEMLKNPRLLRVLLHVAYRRGNRDAKPAQIRDTVGQVSFADALDAWLELLGGGDDGPPVLEESTSKPSEPSTPESDVKSGTSGNGLRLDLGRSEDQLAPTTPGS